MELWMFVRKPRKLLCMYQTIVLTESRDKTDTISSNEAPERKEGSLSSSSLEDHTDRENNARGDQTPSAAKEVTERSSSQGSKEGTSRKDRYDEGRLGSGYEWLSVLVDVGCKLLDPEVHGKNTTNCTSVVSAEFVSKLST